MKKYDYAEFNQEVTKAYDILWKMYASGDWDIDKTEALLRMTNCIDFELNMEKEKER